MLRNFIRLAGLIAISLASSAWASPVDDARAIRIAREALQRLPKAYADSVSVLSYADDEQRSPSPATGGIELLIGDSRASTAFGGVTGNCEADAVSQRIGCDLALLDELSEEFRLGENPETTELLLAIILAHELGHLALDHGRSRYHGNDSAVSVLDYANHKAELEADAFAVELLDRMPEPIGGPYLLIENLARTAIHRSLCPEIFPAICPCPGYTDWTQCTSLPVGPGLAGIHNDRLRVTLKGSHPVYVIRFLRMLYLSKDPQVHNIYSGQARLTLELTIVRDENGVEQNTKPLFRDIQREEAIQARVGRKVREDLRGSERIRTSVDIPVPPLGVAMPITGSEWGGSK